MKLLQLFVVTINILYNFAVSYVFSTVFVAILTLIKHQIMKKVLLLIVAGLFIISYSFAQSLSLSNSGGALNNGDTVTVAGPLTSTIYVYAFVENLTSSPIDVKVRKIEIDTVPGSKNYLCWGLCFDPIIYVSPDPITINGNSINDVDFSGDYKAQGNPGVTKIRYVFFDENNPTDSVYIQVHFDATSGINDISKDIIFSNAYPNPASVSTTISYSLPANSNNTRIIIRDLLGATVKEILITDFKGKKTIITSDMDDGIYFYSLVLDEKIITSKKLIIRN